MSLEPGMRFGAYAIDEPIGAGGMGEVYRAHDTALERDVAIKVLPASFADDASRVARFEREAKTLAALNHPNIAQIYGLERSDGTTALVMELVEGPTLADRIAEGPLPADEALGVAMQIADALEAAHGQSIVHRDLKPANVKLRHDGTVKVLDFGIAKPLDIQQASGPGAPVLTTPAMTQTGIILGTAAYMSPEQARGKPVDQRTDIWAFGCLLYEMLTGQPAFAGEDIAITLARILANDTNMKSLPAAISPAVRQTIELCLQKDARKRIADIRDVKLALTGAFDAVSPAATGAAAVAKPAWRRALPVAAALLVGGVLASRVFLSLEPAPAPRPVNRFDYDLPPGQAFTRFPERNVIALSRDGRSIVYNASGGLYLRALGDLEAHLIPGTEEPLADPFISPDGQSVAYFAPTSSQIKRIPLSGGAAVVIAAASAPFGASWAADGTILFGQTDGIHRVPANGGTSELIIPRAGAGPLYGPRLLPDGDTVLFNAGGEIVAQSLSTGDRTALISAGTDARYLPTGHLVYAFEDGLFAVAFDPETLTVSGAAVPLAQGVMRAALPGVAANYDVSDDGTLVYIRGSVLSVGRVLVWVDREGREEPIAAPPRAYTSPRISPDGTKIALNARDEDLDIWIWDIVRRTLTRLSFDPGQDRFPAWSPDGGRIAYSSQQGAAAGGFSTALVWQAADGTGVIERLAESPGQMFPTAFLPDATGIVVYGDMTDADDDMALVKLTGERELMPLLDTTFNEAMAELSSDGHWMAYVSDESGKNEVYVRPFPQIDAGRWQISTGGGAEPLWARDGRQLFYRTEDGLFAVPIETDPAFAVGNPEIVVEGTYFAGLSAGGRSYDVSGDGQRFLMIKPAADAATAPQIVIVENWFEELKRLVPTE